MELVILELAAVALALAGHVAAGAVQAAGAEVAAELAVGVVADARPIRLTLAELAAMAEAVGIVQAAHAVVEVVAKLAFVHGAVLAEATVTVHAAGMEFTLIDAAFGVAETAEAVEQAVLELALVAIAGGAVPGAEAVPLAVLELAEVVAAVRVVDTSAALQQAVDDLPAVAAAVGQHCIGRGEWLALAAGGEQADQQQGNEAQHAGIRSGRRPAVCRKPNGLRHPRRRAAQRMHRASVSAM